MGTRRFRGLRIFVIIMLVLMVFQYELGMATTLSDPPELKPFGFSFTSPDFSNAMDQLSFAGQINTSFGAFLVISSLVTLILSLRSHARSMQVFGSLAFLATLIAGINGLLFVQSGFQNDNFSHGMATFFLLGFIFYFLELYFLKPAGNQMNTRSV
jgi:hypothetical protein